MNEKIKQTGFQSIPRQSVRLEERKTGQPYQEPMPRIEKTKEKWWLTHFSPDDTISLPVNYERTAGSYK